MKKLVRSNFDIGGNVPEGQHIVAVDRIPGWPCTYVFGPANITFDRYLPKHQVISDWCHMASVDLSEGGKIVSDRTLFKNPYLEDEVKCNVCGTPNAHVVRDNDGYRAVVLHYYHTEDESGRMCPDCLNALKS